MCSSKPKIPKNTTPVAPPAPEPGPGTLTIGNEREQLARSRGLTIPSKPDLSGLGNQEMGAPVTRLVIDPGSRTVVDAGAREVQEAAAATAAANTAQRERRAAMVRGRRR
jgi:hypothetical protein